MTTFKKQISINVPKQDVWDIISDLGAIYKFNPGVSKSYYTTDQKEGVGAARICELQPAGKILETVKNWKKGSGFLLQIDPIEKAPPIKNFSGLFELESLDLDRTQLSVTIDYSMKLGVIGLLLNKLIIQSKMEEGIDDLLKGLKLHAEKGLIIKNMKSLEVFLKLDNN